MNLFPNIECNEYFQPGPRHDMRRVFEDEYKVIELANEYLEHLAENPIKVTRKDTHRGQIINVVEERPRVPNIAGFAAFCGCGQGTIYNILKRENDTRRVAMEAVVTRFKAEQIEGGAAGIYHAQISMRLAGLTEKSETVVRTAPAQPSTQALLGEDVANLPHPDCSDDQLAAIYAAGLQPPLYSKRQLELGVPFVMPDLPDQQVIAAPTQPQAAPTAPALSPAPTQAPATPTQAPTAPPTVPRPWET